MGHKYNVTMKKASCNRDKQMQNTNFELKSNIVKDNRIELLCKCFGYTVVDIIWLQWVTHEHGE